MKFSTLSHHAGISHKRGPFTFYSAVRGQDNTSNVVLVKLISKEHPYFLEGARQLEHEHRLSQHLDLTRIMRSLSLEKSQDYVALVFEDSHIISLDRIIKRKLNTLEFLLFANDICYALLELHSKHIVHSNLNPQNIYYFFSDNLFKIAGLEFAQFEHENYQSDEDRHLFKDSIPYISPEQTGRTTLRVDHRSDLYSVGMIFYEMLTNQLPFNADTPADWMYCHLAKVPAPPSDLNPKVPTMVSKIVSKLLNKVPKERYQSAYGLKMDIERCLTQFKNENRIYSFSLAGNDIPARIETPKHIYGREKELNLLSLAYKRVSSFGITELALILGYAGVGKTSLINSFLQKLSGPFIFASGKFDEYNRTVPYFAIKQALANLCRQLLSKNEDELKSWKNSISAESSISIAIIANLVPEVQFITGKQPPIASQSGPEAKHQFQNAFKAFIKVFSKIDHPLILFLDDLQWADDESLDLIEYLLAQKNVEYFFLIGAFRDHEINASHPRATALQKLEQVGVRNTLIKLNSMTRDELKVMLKDILQTDSQNVDQLSEIIHEKTEGNPFFSIELLKNIESQNLIWFNWIQKRWEWDSDSILKMEYSSNVIDLMTDRLRRLPESSQRLLMFAASLGNFFQKSVLLIASNWTEKELDQELNLISSLGFIVEASQGNDSGFSFVHDRIRQTAYLLIPETDRAGIHLQIGRRLISGLSPSLIDLWSFDLANHFNFASSLLCSEEEIERVVILNLSA
ncbi:MAG: AAA family ATPase, partial [Bdellovibrionia bacterium]